MAQAKTYLKDFKLVKNNLKNCKKSQVCALHKLVFEIEGDRKNRQRLRDFSGFTFKENDNEYKLKAEYAVKNLNQTELMSIAWVLGLDCNQINVPKILRNLCAENFLKDLVEDDDDDDDDDDEDEGEEVNAGNRTMVNNYRQNDAEEEDDVQSTNSQQSLIESIRSILENEEVCNQRRRNNSRTQPQRFALSFRDIEDTIRPFDGTTSMTINDWIQEFEQTSTLYHWDEVQMLVFARKSLTGLARQFVNGEKGLSTWGKLKRALENEFRQRTNSRRVHQLLTERTMKKGENVMEYFYTMKEIASKGDITDKDLILYVIDGIKDVNSNKQLLYGAYGLREFKEKIRDYEEFIAARPTTEDRRKTETKSTTAQQINEKKTMIKCYNCGSKGHISVNCKNKSKGLKCFNCNVFGHIANECKNKTTKKEEREVNSVNSVKLNYKDIKISNKHFTALIDTGSVCNIMREDVYKLLNKPVLKKSNIMLSGFGSNNNKVVPMGQLTQIIEIDGESYELDFQVTPNECLNTDIILGAPISLQAEIVINQNGLNIRKNGSSDSNEGETYDIMQINLTNENDEVHIGETASENVKEAVKQLIENYTPQKSRSTNVSMKIIINDDVPIYSRPRRLPLAERQLVERQIDEWISQGIVEISESEYSSPIVLVAKKGGAKRLCIDYRRLNKIIVKDRFPLPLIEDQLDRLQDAKIFSSIDLKNGFFHVDVDESSRHFTAFVTHNGQYQFKKVPFGLCNSPAVFQRHINAIFREFTQKGIALPYVDDIIIPAKTEDEAVERLNEVLKLCKEYGLDINFKKSHFIKTSIEFLGHVIQDQKIYPSPSKTEAMINYPVPTNIKQVESFLGLSGYFRKFVPNYATLARPLSDLRKKGVKFAMQENEIRAVNQLKNILANSPVLKIFNERHETELHTDASVDGFGAILMQKCPEDDRFHPVYYMSKKTSDAQRKYSSYELEILAVIEALKKFRVYLIGRHFKIVTDCNAFTKTMEKKDLCTRVARWLLLLQEYDYSIEHRSGTSMRHVDALSRHHVMTINEETTLNKIKMAQISDDELKPIITILQRDEHYNDFYVKAGILYKLVDECEKIVVPSALQHEIIKRAHEKGHFALKKTKELIDDEYYIPKMDEKIQKCIANCIKCLLVNRKYGKQEGELHPLMKPEVPLHTYHVDHLGPLESTSKNYKHIFVVTDAFTKFSWLYPTKSTTSNEVITRLRLQSNIFGNPAVIISDRGTAFTSGEFGEYCVSEGIVHHKITTGLPRANGQVERLNSIIAAVLAKLSIDDPTKWYRHVDQVQKVMNSTYHRSIKKTPFEILIGTKMRSKDDVHIREMIEAEIVAQFELMREDFRKDAKLQIAKVQEENRQNYNAARKPPTKYKVNDTVAIKRTQYGGGLKLRPKFLGPYRVKAVKPNDTYDVTKIGDGPGPMVTSTCAEYMKVWPSEASGT